MRVFNAGRCTIETLKALAASRSVRANGESAAALVRAIRDVCDNSLADQAILVFKGLGTQLAYAQPRLGAAIDRLIPDGVCGPRCEEAAALLDEMLIEETK